MGYESERQELAGTMTSCFPLKITSHFGYLLKFNIAKKDRYVSLECHILRFHIPGTARLGSENESVLGTSASSTAEFEIVETSILQLQGCTSAKLITLRKCRDALTGVTQPYVLVQKKIGPSRSQSPVKCEIIGIFHDDLTRTPSSLSLVSAGEYVLESTTDLRNLSSNDVHILDGQSVIYLDSHRNILHQFCVENGSFSLIKTNLYAHKDTLVRSCHKLLTLTRNATEKLNNNFFLYGCVDCSRKDREATASGDASNRITFAKSEFFALILQQTENSYKHLKLGREDVTKIIPHEYSSIVNAVVVNTISFTVDEMTSADKNSGVKLKQCTSHVYACTSQHHLLEFENGHLVRCVNIETPSVSKMWLTLDHFLEPHLCLWSADDRLFLAVRSQDFQVKTSKTGVEHVVTDDFIGNGTDQALLLSDSPSTWPPSQWVLTDFGPTYIEGVNQQASESRKCQSDSSSIQAAIKALQIRLQSDVIKLGELNSEEDDRQRLIDLTCGIVDRLTLNQEPVLTAQPNLVPLLGNDDSTNSCHMTTPHSVIGQKWLEVKDTWQRLCDGCWVIGVDVCNVSHQDLSDLTLCTCLPSHVGLQKEYQISRSFWPMKRDVLANPHATNQAEPLLQKDDWVFKPTSAKQIRLDQHTDAKHKKQILHPRETTTVFCVLSQPLFGADLKDQLLLFLTFLPSHQEHRKHDSGENQKLTLFCGHVEFSKEELFDSKHLINLRSSSTKAMSWQDNEIRRNRLSLDVSQEMLRLSLMSTQTGLTDVENLLTRAGVTYQPVYDCFLCPQELENFRWVRLQLIDAETTTSKPVIQLHFRDKAQLWALFHYLYHILPDDVTMVPENQSEASEVRHLATFKQMMKSEIEFSITELNELLNKYVKGDEIMEVEMEQSSGQQPSDRVSVLRKNFSQMRKDVQRKRKDGVIAGEYLRNFIIDKQKYSQTTDSAIIQMLNGFS